MTIAGMEELVSISRFYGGDPEIVLGGGGNTSVKSDGVLHVKASGSSLAAITAEGFVALDRAQLQALLGRRLSDDARIREEQFKDAIMAARLEPQRNQRPSVEAVLHHLMPSRFVVHTHPTLVNMVACCTDGETICGELFGDEVLWLPPSAPGMLLALQLNDAMRDYAARTGRSGPPAVIMANHGLVVCGESVEEIRKRTEAILGAIRSRLDSLPARHAFGEIRRLPADQAARQVDVIAPALRGLLGEGEHLEVVVFDDGATAISMAGGSEARAITAGGPLIPDHIVYCQSMPLWFKPDLAEPVERTVERLAQAVTAHRRQTGFPPNVVLVEGVGMFAAGGDLASARTVRQVYINAIDVLGGARRLGGILYMSSEHRTFVESWEAEAYRRKIAAAKRTGRAAGKVVVVTGAAQGIGLDIARDLAAQGACVVLADLNVPQARSEAEKLPNAVAAEMNVTDEASVRRGLHEVVRSLGGLDVLICNAGVLRAGSVKDQPLADFDFVTAVNYRGYFLCVQKAAPIMAVQRRARAGWMGDIIQINSKSGLVGSNRNAAYAGSKFGGIGLTQSLAMELLEDGIKVNAICPGNFFDGPLWSDSRTGLFVQYLAAGKVPGAKTVQDVRRAYEAKIPMGRGCTIADLMKAVYYLIEQKYETGQALPVTGGQVMLS